MIVDTDRAMALLRRLLSGRSWVVVHDPETARATFVSVAGANSDLDLGDEISAVADQMGLTPRKH